jgi:hypothetical protein
MTRDADIELTLERARRALTPTQRDAERVLQATLACVVAAAPAATPPVQAKSMTSASGAAGASPGLKVLAALVLAVGSGAMGYRLGLHDGQQAHESLRSAAQSSAASTPATANETSARADNDRSQDRVEQAADLHALENSLEQRALVRTATRTAPSAVPEPPRARGHLSAESATEAPGISLSEELEIVKRVERALRASEPDVALNLLDDLALRQPEGALLEERAAASCMARCAMGLGGRDTLAQDFARAFPRSAYLQRVEAACAGQVRP